MRAFRTLTITHFILNRFIRNVICNIRILLLNRTNRARLIFTHTTLNIRTLFRINLNIPCRFTSRLNRLQDILNLFPYMALMDLNSFKVALTINLATRNRVRTRLNTFTRRIILRTLPRFLTNTLTITSGILNRRFRIALLFSSFSRFLFTCLARQTLLEYLEAFISMATCNAAPFLYRGHDGICYLCSIYIIREWQLKTGFTCGGSYLFL